MQHSLVRLERSAVDRDGLANPAVFGTVLAGTPAEACVTLFDARNARFSAGVWECSPGLIAMKNWPYDEFCVLLAGRVVITPEGGAPQEYAQGDALVIPKGFTGTWDIRETVRKYYAIQKHPGPLVSLKRAVRSFLTL